MFAKRSIRMLVVTGAVIVGMGSSAAFAVSPSITVTPNKKLANAQVVKVAGKNFPKNDSLVIVQCNSKVATDGSAACDLHNIIGVRSDASGKVPSTSFTVHTGAIGTDGGTCDKTHACIIAVSEPSATSTVHAAATITFK